MKKEKSQAKNRGPRSKLGVVNYPIGDFLVRVKNAALARREEVSMPSSKFVKSAAEILKKYGFLEEVREKEGKLTAKISYLKGRGISELKPAILEMKLISKPGLRIYMGVKRLQQRRGHSIFLVSTARGLMASQDAVKQGLGGEVIAEIW